MADLFAKWAATGAILAVLSAHSASNPAIAANTIDRPDLIKAAEDAICDTLRDCDSAKFKNVIAVQTADSKGAVCGEVNAKNGYGGYVGFQQFIYMDGKIVTAQTMAQAVPEFFSFSWHEFCD